jgi:hypothetical protein
VLCFFCLPDYGLEKQLCLWEFCSKRKNKK